VSKETPWSGEGRFDTAGHRRPVFVTAPARPRRRPRTWRAAGAKIYALENAIAMAREFEAVFTRHLNKSQFSVLVNRLIEATRNGDPVTVDQAVSIVQMAIRYYGPTDWRPHWTQ
jgi:hypothetical protein